MSCLQLPCSWHPKTYRSRTYAIGWLAIRADRRDQALLPNTITEDTKCQVAERTEYDDDREVCLEAIKVVVIEMAIEPSICADICQDRQLRWQRHLRCDEATEELGDGATIEPLS
ncbi:hypothetical protein AMS68_005436 [Peltaster fructicola]|uniref:Uncharacterized protein n=1 Tax=Peltaster fructicola TaxID=286661 RepID=A0A6H0XZ77_9PEZI|nr:hypothetical protein AMS68_005436 [Peltaster fructicola]